MKERQIKLNAIEFEGYDVTVTVEGGIDEYAKALLHIFNNVRESRELFSVENYCNNDITVYCDLDSKQALIDYLENFGTIKRCKKVLLYQLEDNLPDCDFDKYWAQVIVPYTE